MVLQVKAMRLGLCALCFCPWRFLTHCLSMILAFCSSEMGTPSKSAGFAGVPTSLSAMGAVELGRESEWCRARPSSSLCLLQALLCAAAPASSSSSSRTVLNDERECTWESDALDGDPTRGGILGTEGAWGPEAK
jgi:hypothetical protein